MNMPLRAAQDAKTLGERADESKLWLVAAALAVGLLPALLANYAPSLGKLRFPATSVHGEDAAIPPGSFAWVKPHDLDGVSERSVRDNRNPAIDVLPQAPVPYYALRARVWMLTAGSSSMTSRNSLSFWRMTPKTSRMWTS